MTISRTAPMLVSRSWLSRSRSPSAVAVSPRRMKTIENEAMKSRLGPRTLRQSVDSISSTRDAGDDREVAGHQRQHAGREERDQPGDEGDRDVGSVDGVHRSSSTARLPRADQFSAAASRRRCSRASSSIGAELGEDPDHHLPDQVARARRPRLGDRRPAAPRAPPRSRPRPRRRTRCARRRSGSPSPWPRRAAPGRPGPRRESLPGAVPSSSSASPVVAAGEQQLAERRRRQRAWPGSSSSASRSEASSPTATSSSAGEGTSVVEPAARSARAGSHR